MKQQSAYTKMLYDLVSEKIGMQSKGKIRLDFSDSKHYDCMTELFGGKESMKNDFPYNYNVLKTSRSNGSAMTDNAGTTGFVDFSRIQSIFYAKNTKELSTMSYANLTSVAKSIFLTTTVFRKGEQIEFNSGFSFNVSNAVLETLTEDILPFGGDDDELLVVFHVSWQKNNVMYSEVNYDLKNSRESSLNEIVKEITVNDPMNKNTPADSAIYVAFGRTPAMGEVLDYPYPESRIDRLQKMFLEISGEATLIDGAKFVSGNPNQTGIVLNHPDMGTIFYNQTLPASCIQKVSDNKFKWTIDKDWQNTIPSSVLAGIREYAFDMSLSFSAIRANERTPSNYTIEIASFEKPQNPHYKKINNIKLQWGCLADNSRIRMADGSQKMINEIAIGNMVRTPEGGSKKVVNVWTGPRAEILHIETDGGAVINLTDTHPVMTKEGLKPACALTLDDQLLMEDGQYQKIQFFNTLSYDRFVYNLDLEDGHTFICDDFVVGDFNMQNTMYVKKMSSVTADAELVREFEILEYMTKYWAGNG